MLLPRPPLRFYAALATLIALGALPSSLDAATLTLDFHGEAVATTPEILGVNAGHFDDGSNTLSRVLYMRPNGMRLFINGIQFVSRRNNRYDMEPWGDGVGTETEFRARRLALRDDPLNPAFIDWEYYRDRLASWRLTGINVMTVPRVLDLLTDAGIEILSQTTISKAHLGFDGADDWASRWEYWKFYYAYAFLMLDTYGIRKFQMYNEPNHSASGIDDDFPGYLERLRLASDAMQSAFSDYNRIHGTAHAVRVFAPVLAGLNRDWTEAVASFMSVPLVDDGTGFNTLFHSFSYQRYNAAPIPFGAEATTARSLVEGAARRSDFDVSITEFNVHTNATFANMEETLDTPEKFARLGGIYARLLLNLPDQLYAFKFSQTDGRDRIGIRKNGLAYVDNAGAPYDVGGMTGGFEVVRLFNEAFAGRQHLLRLPANNIPANLRDSVHIAAARRHDGSYRIAIANEAGTALNWNLNLEAFATEPGALIEVEEVSAARLGEIVRWETLGSSKTLGATQPPRSLWMIRAIPAESFVEAASHPPLAGALMPSATHFEGISNEPLRARHHLNDPQQRSVLFATFDNEELRDHKPSRAYLRLRGSTEAGADDAVYHVYAVIDGWKAHRNARWEDMPHLRHGTAAWNAPRINAGLVGGEERNVRLVGTFRSAASEGMREHRFDVTKILRRHGHRAATFLISRDIRDVDDETVNTSAWTLDTESNEPAFTLHSFTDPHANPPVMTVSMENRLPTLRWTQGPGQILNLESAPHPTGPWNALQTFPKPPSETRQTYTDDGWNATSSRFYRLRTVP